MRELSEKEQFARLDEISRSASGVSSFGGVQRVRSLRNAETETLVLRSAEDGADLQPVEIDPAPQVACVELDLVIASLDLAVA